MPRKKGKGPPERIVGLIESVRVEERPRRDPLVSLLITVVGGDGTGQLSAVTALLTKSKSD